MADDLDITDNLDSGRLGSPPPPPPRPVNVPELPISEHENQIKNEIDKDSVVDLESEYLINLYLAHFPDPKKSKDQEDPEFMATTALKLENTAIQLPIDQTISDAFVELITRAIIMLKTVEIADLKDRIFDVILKCSSILLNKDTHIFEKLVIELDKEQIMDFITRAIQMFKTVKEKDPIKEVYLKNDIFIFIYQCSNILFKEHTISFEYALNIANDILYLIVHDVTKAFEEVETFNSPQEKIQKLEDVQKKLEDAKEKYSIYLNADGADVDHPGFVISVKENAETDKNWKETDRETQLFRKLTHMKEKLTYLNRQINNRKMLAEARSTKESAKPRQLHGSVDPSTSSRSLASTAAQRRRERSMSRFPTPGNAGGMATRKKYRRRNKRNTKHYKKKAKRYTKKRNRRY